jgi:hypothetical protein
MNTKINYQSRIQTMSRVSAQTAPRPTSKRRPRRRDGRSFELSGRYQSDDPSWTLVHGTIEAKVITKGNALTRFSHAWLKRDGWVYDSVLDKSYEESHYVKIYAAHEAVTYTRDAAARVMLAAKHWGPWIGELIDLEVLGRPPVTTSEADIEMLLRAGTRHTDIIDHDRLRRYAELCAVEPGLVLLLIDAMREQPTTDSFIESYKPRFKRLVGDDARLRQLRTSAAYDVVYDTIYDLVVDQ